MKIPNHALYLMLCYAWHAVEDANPTEVGPDNGLPLLELLTSVLFRTLNQTFRTGLWRSYIPNEEELAMISGKVDFPKTLLKMSAPKGKAVCSQEEMTFDTYPNQIIKSTIRSLADSELLSKPQSEEARFILRKLSEVSFIPLDLRRFNEIQVDRNHNSYRLMLSICKLIAQHRAAINEGLGHSFEDYFQDESKLWKLFQEFVASYLRRNFGDRCWVGSRSYPWFGVESSHGNTSLIPNLNTDVTVETKENALIIDTKFYQNPLLTHFGKKMVRPDHLYQLMGYVHNYQLLKPDIKVSGMLLYPSIGYGLYEEYTLGGYKISLRCVDLAQSTAKIAANLDETVTEFLP